VANGVEVVNDWETAYNRSFTRSGGTRPIVISYASSPAFEVLYADEPTDEAPTAAVIADNSCFRQIEFAGILAGTTNRAAAETVLDFLLSTSFQEDIPLQMFMFPVMEGARLDPVFTKHLVLPDSTAYVSPNVIAAERDALIDAWSAVVLGR
jgi:thiamine transport system substrate-binding protein